MKLLMMGGGVFEREMWEGSPPSQLPLFRMPKHLFANRGGRHLADRKRKEGSILGVFLSGSPSPWSCVLALNFLLGLPLHSKGKYTYVQYVKYRNKEERLD